MPQERRLCLLACARVRHRLVHVQPPTGTITHSPPALPCRLRFMTDWLLLRSAARSPRLRLAVMNAAPCACMQYGSTAIQETLRPIADPNWRPSYIPLLADPGHADLRHGVKPVHTVCRPISVGQLGHLPKFPPQGTAAPIIEAGNVPLRFPLPLRGRAP